MVPNLLTYIPKAKIAYGLVILPALPEGDYPHVKIQFNEAENAFLEEYGFAVSVRDIMITTATLYFMTPGITLQRLKDMMWETSQWQLLNSQPLMWDIVTRVLDAALELGARVPHASFD